MLNFNTDADSSINWQYGAMRAVAKKNYSSIRLLVVYEKNANVVYFDGIQLFKEEFGHSYVYDADGNVTSVTDLQKKTTTYEYSNNNLTKITLPTGAKQTYTYDSYHNVISATSPEGVVSNFTYDTYGNNTKVTVGSGTQKIQATATYTSNGNLLSTVTDALGNVTTYGYDTQTGVLNWIKAPGETDTTRTNYTHDNLYRTTSVAKSGTSNSYTYTDDLLAGITSASGTAYAFTYGVFDQISSVKAGTRTLISHTYTSDANRRLSRSDYGNGDYTTYTYDTYGRTTKIGYEDNSSAVQYTYDNNGNLGLLKDNISGRTTKYYYDMQDRLMRYDVTGSGYSSSVKWSYDDLNNLTTQTHTLNGTTYTESYSYDDDNRLTGITNGSVKSTYSYDVFSRMNTITAKYGSTNVVTTTIGYKTPSNTATSAQVATWKNVSSGLTRTYTYTYDIRGNITAISDGTNTTTYVYDGMDQLIRENNQAAGKTWTYTYDNGGNITSKKEYAYTTGTLGTATNTISYAYGDSNWKDLLTSYNGNAITSDAIGNVLSDGTWTYTWQHGRQLAGMSKTGTTISYAYNADGMRTQKTVNGTVTKYDYLGSQLVHMTSGSNTLHFKYDSLGAESVNYNGTEYYYAKNAQGDITGIVNTSGTIVVEYTYDAWGNILSTTGSMAATLGAINPFRYRGYVYDTETGLYYLQTRYYNPAMGRFICADSYASTGVSLLGCNMFAYCNNDPINAIDPSGELALVDDAFAIIGLLCVTAFALIYTSSDAGKIGWKGICEGIYDTLSSIKEEANELFNNKTTVLAPTIGAKACEGALTMANRTTPKTSTRNKVLADVKMRVPRRGDYVYQLAYVNSIGSLIRLGQKMTYEQALIALNASAIVNYLKQNHRHLWGIYTYSQAYAKRLAYAVGLGGGPEVHTAGYYGHYHDSTHEYHIWFGGPIWY